MTDNIASKDRRRRALFGFVAGACAGMPVAFVTLTLFCFLTMGTDCRDGYIGMMFLAPIAILVCAAAGAALAAASARAADAVVGGSVGVLVGFGVGFYAMATGMSSAALVIVPVALAGLGAAIGWWLARRRGARGIPVSTDLIDTLSRSSLTED